MFVFSISGDREFKAFIMSQESSDSSQSQESLTRDEVIAAIRKHCPWEVFKRTWYPKESGPKELAAFSSVIGGAHIFLPDGSMIPSCKTCKRKKTIACQFDIASFPAKVKEDLGISEGLIQTFFCVDRRNCNFEPFQNARLVPNAQVNEVKYSLFGQCGKVIMKNNLNIDVLPKHLQKKLNELHPFLTIKDDVYKDTEWQVSCSDDEEEQKPKPEIIDPNYVYAWPCSSLEMPSTDHEIMDLYPIISEKTGIPLEKLEDLECAYLFLAIQ